MQLSHGPHSYSFLVIFFLFMMCSSHLNQVVLRGQVIIMLSRLLNLSTKLSQVEVELEFEHNIIVKSR